MNQQPIQGSKLQQATTKACPIDMPHLNLTMELIVVIVIMENPYPMYQPHADHPIL